MRLQVRPTIKVMEPASERTVPRTLYGRTPVVQPKMDGWRVVAFVGAGGEVVLQSRGGKDVTAHFPEFVPDLAALPAGTVLDGEALGWHGGVSAYGELAHTPAVRAQNGVVVQYAAFDQLAVGGRDIRPWPLSERLDALERTLAGELTRVQPLMRTSDHDEALTWYAHLHGAGAEGVVAKDPLSGYEPGPTRRWVKVRHVESVDGRVIAVYGSPDKPTGMTVRLEGGRVVSTSARLEPVASRTVAAAVAGHTGESKGVGVWRVVDGPLVEVSLRPGRHPAARFVRVRTEP